MKSVPTKKTRVFGAALFAAALALPSYHSLFAEAAPEHGIVAFKYLKYQDSQPGQDRIGVNAYSVSAMTPIDGKWSINTSYTYDSVSGASPRLYDEFDTVAGASKLTEKRNAGDVSVTRYLEKGSVTIGTSYSSESDYISRGYSFQQSFLTNDNNTTFTLGGSYNNDTINAVKKGVFDKNKEVFAGLLGVTKVLTKQDIVQVNVAFSRGRGYFSDPYKENEGDIFDPRPNKREITTLMTRWNHHFDSSDGTARMGYRYYTDSYDITAHTFTAEYVQPVPYGFTITPLLRYSSQSAAYFYIPKASFDPFAADLPAKPYSYDERLSAFGAITFGIKAEKKLGTGWIADLKYEQYKQRSGWCLTGNGDSELKPFRFTSVQVGLSRQL
ncbi:MAG: DUF3570 domain-containing protein [Chlorobiaceae bacterium]